MLMALKVVALVLPLMRMLMVLKVAALVLLLMRMRMVLKVAALVLLLMRRMVLKVLLIVYLQLHFFFASSHLYLNHWVFPDVAPLLLMRMVLRLLLMRMVLRLLLARIPDPVFLFACHD
jgi:hypothetical protein